MVVALVLLFTALATASVQWRLRSEALARQFALASLTVRALEDQLTQSLNVVERTLLLSGSSPQRSDKLKAFLQQAPYIRSIALENGQGVIEASTNAANLGLRLPRQQFMPQSTEPLGVLRTGPLTAGRDFADSPLAGQPAQSGISFIPVALDVMQDDQRWVTVLATLNTDYFLNFYSNHISPQQGQVALLRYDGSLIISTDPQARPGQPDPSRLLPARLAQTDADSYRETWPGGQRVLTAYRASRVYPFVLAVHLDETRALAPWRQEAWRTAWVVASVLLILLGVATDRKSVV